MKLKGQITFLINRESTTIEVHDDDACTTFVSITLTPEQLSAILSRQSMVECELDVRGIEKVGKKHECRNFEFEVTYSKDDKDLSVACEEALFKEGLYEWVSDNYYHSQNTFFKKDGKQYARTTIRRWV